jgi:hypothetical protein
METGAIGTAGELLVQYKLLKHGIDSARLTVDRGIDLVMYVPGRSKAATIQVKTNEIPTPAGGKGKLHLGWNFDDDCPAEWLACADLSTDRAWLFTIERARKLAQQHHPNDVRRLYWFIDDAPPGATHQSEMEPHRLEEVAAKLCGG